MGDEIRELDGKGFSSPASHVRQIPVANLNENGQNFNFYDASSSPKLERFDLQAITRTESDFSSSKLRNSFKTLDQFPLTTSKFSASVNPIAYRYGEKNMNQAGSVDQLERGFMSVTGSNPIFADTRSYQSITPSLPREQRMLNSPSYLQGQEVQSI